MFLRLVGLINRVNGPFLPFILKIMGIIKIFIFKNFIGISHLASTWWIYKYIIGLIYVKKWILWSVFDFI